MQDDDQPTIDRHELAPGEERICRALGSLKPRQPGFDARAIMTEAALRRAHRRVWLWRGVSGALAASLLLTFWSRRPTNTPDTHGLSATHIGALSTEPSDPTSNERALAEAREPDVPALPAASPVLLAGDNYFAIRDRLDLLGPTALSLGTNEGRPASSSAPDRPRVPPMRAMPMRSGTAGPAGPVSRLLRWFEPGERI